MVGATLAVAQRHPNKKNAYTSNVIVLLTLGSRKGCPYQTVLLLFTIAYTSM